MSRSASSAVWGSLLALAILTAALRLPFAEEPPGRDQGLFMTEAHLLASGGLLYGDVWEHKPPGVVSLYGAAMGIFGDHYTAIRLLNALAGFATAALLLLLFVRAGRGAITGFCAGALYLFFFAGPLFGGFWATAQVEIFVDPCVAAALCALFPRRTLAPERVASNGHLLAAGVALGTAVFWLKYSCAPLAGLAFFAFWPGTPPAEQDSQRRAKRAAVLLIGMLVPPLVMLAYFGLGGRIGEFWDATILFNLAHREVSLVAPDSFVRWLALIFIWPVALAPLYCFTAVALFSRFTGPNLRVRWALGGDEDCATRDRLLAAGFVLWLLAIAQILLQGKFWLYHYHVLLLPLAITAALGVDVVVRRLAGRIGGRAAWSVTAAIALALCWPHASLLREYLDAHQVGAHWRGELSREEFLASYVWGSGGDYDAAENRAVAARVAAETAAGDTVFVWGFEPSIYFLAGRKPASRFLYDYPIMPELTTVHERHVASLMQDLESSSPALFLVLHRDQNDLETRDSAAQLRALPALRAYLSRHYRPIWRLGDFSAFRRQALSTGQGSAGR